MIVNGNKVSSVLIFLSTSSYNKSGNSLPMIFKPLYYSFNLSAAVICVYLSCCCINKFILPLLLLLLLLLISAIYLVNEDY